MIFKKLREENEDLKDRIEVLEDTIRILERENADLEKEVAAIKDNACDRDIVNYIRSAIIERCKRSDKIAVFGNTISYCVTGEDIFNLVDAYLKLRKHIAEGSSLPEPPKEET